MNLNEGHSISIVTAQYTTFCVGITLKFENPGYKEFELFPPIGGTLTYALSG